MSRHVKRPRILPRKGKPVTNRGSLDLTQLQAELSGQTPKVSCPSTKGGVTR